MDPVILGVSGSIRPGASSTTLLHWIGEQLVPVVRFDVFDQLHLIPPFDGAEPAPSFVEKFVEAIQHADLVIFCSPEYAHGVPGVLKNALDWTVATDAWINKRAAVITAAGQGQHAHDSLIETLKTMSAVIDEHSTLLIPFVRAKISADGEITDPATAGSLQKLCHYIGSLLKEDAL